MQCYFKTADFYVEYYNCEGKEAKLDTFRHKKLSSTRTTKVPRKKPLFPGTSNDWVKWPLIIFLPFDMLPSYYNAMWKECFGWQRRVIWSARVCSHAQSIEEFVGAIACHSSIIIDIWGCFVNIYIGTLLWWDNCYLKKLSYIQSSFSTSFG